MKNEHEFYEVLKEINEYTKRKAEGKVKGKEVRKCEDLIKSLYEIKEFSCKKNIRTGDNEKEGINEEYVIFKTVNGKCLKYYFKNWQLRNIYLSLINSFSSEDVTRTGILYKQNLNESDIFEMVLNKVCYLWQDNFEFKNEGGLVNYLKSRLHGIVVNEFLKNNEMYIKNNMKLYSLENIIEENNTREENNEMNGGITYFEKIDGDNDTNEYTTYNMMFEGEFNYSENEKLRVIPDNEQDYSDVNISWAKRFWDGNLDLDKQTLKILSERDLDLHTTHQEELKFYISQYRNFLTSSQVEKIDKLVMAMETENIINYNCSSKKNEDGIYTYNDNYFKFNLVEVGKILHPNRKGNSNKDIEQFITSCRSRLEKYLIKNKKEYLIKDILTLQNIA